MNTDDVLQKVRARADEMQKELTDLAKGEGAITETGSIIIQLEVHKYDPAKAGMIRLWDVELSIRTRKGICRVMNPIIAGRELTLNDVAAVSPHKFKGIKNFGETSFRELKRSLEHHKLIDQRSPWYDIKYSQLRKVD